MKTTLKQAIAKIEASITSDKQSVIYFDDSTRHYYLAPIEDIDDLRELMDDDDTSSDAYSHWCAGNSHDECTPDGEPLTTVTIGDVGCCDKAIWDGVKLRGNGSPHVEKILKSVDFSESDLDTLASEIMAAWSVGYDGDMAEQKVVVKVVRGEDCAELRA